MEHELSFCKFIKHSESLLEAVISEPVDIEERHADEVNALMDELFTSEYGVLVDSKCTFSISFRAASKIGNSKLQKR